MEVIKNFIQLTDNFGTAGQPTEKQFKLVAESGYKHVINLGMPDHPHAVADEGKLVSELGMNYIHIPVQFDNPSKEQVKLFCNIMSLIRTERVFIHCIMNYRVSAFMYHYLSKVEKLSDKDSKSIMFNYWELDPVWEELMSWTASDIGL